jgi:hypothetical protein
MDWNVIENKEDMKKLLDVFGYFHDGCFREMHLWNSFYVGDCLGMGQGDEKMRCKILFQRQFRDPSAIEVLFEGMVQMNIVATEENYWGDIFGATLIEKDGLYYWANEEGWSPDNLNSEYTTWVCARTVKWRDRSEYMGDSIRYGDKELL